MAEILQRPELRQLMRLQRVRRRILRSVELELQRQQPGGDRARNPRPGHPGDTGFRFQHRQHHIVRIPVAPGARALALANTDPRPPASRTAYQLVRTRRSGRGTVRRVAARQRFNLLEY